VLAHGKRKACKLTVKRRRNVIGFKKENLKMRSRISAALEEG